MPHDNLHPAGKGFRGVITGHGVSEAKNSNQQIFIHIQNQETSDQRITAFLSMSETKTRTPGMTVIDYTVDKLRRCGWKGYSLADIENGELLVGNEIIYEVDHEVYDGTTRAKVGWINDPEGGIQRAAATQDNISRFEQIAKQNPPQNTPAQEPAASPALADGDCPFPMG
jgi:hypothetical protein